jgi:hypothetical protein
MPPELTGMIVIAGYAASYPPDLHSVVMESDLPPGAYVSRPVVG